MPNRRVHVVIPKELTDEIDSLVGQRRRSAFICDATREKLIQHKQVKAIRKFSGSLKEGDYPEWNHGSAEWVSSLRNEDQEIRDRSLRFSDEPPSNRHERYPRRPQKKTRSR